MSAAKLGEIRPTALTHGGVRPLTSSLDKPFVSLASVVPRFLRVHSYRNDYVLADCGALPGRAPSLKDLSNVILVLYESFISLF